LIKDYINNKAIKRIKRTKLKITKTGSKIMRVIKKIYLIITFLIFAFLAYQCGENKNKYNTSQENEPQTETQENQGNNEAAVTKGNPVDGKTYFDQTCAACHGMNGKGLPKLGKDLTTSKFVAEKSDAELLDFIKKGRLPTDPLNTTGVAMPPKGGNPALTDQQLMDIISYIRQIHQ
jgi:disulfide bond formation protein DsbB